MKINASFRVSLIRRFSTGLGAASGTRCGFIEWVSPVPFA
jgi:hypothetical protein